MTPLINKIWQLKIWTDTRGQDFYEYALIVAFIASAYAAIAPGIAANVSTVFSKVTSNVALAGS